MILPITKYWRYVLMVWEYKIIMTEKFLSSDDNLTVEEKFNKWGKNAWEFAGIVQKPYTTLGKDPKIDGDCLIFKRCKEN